MFGDENGRCDIGYVGDMENCDIKFGCDTHTFAIFYSFERHVNVHFLIVPIENTFNFYMSDVSSSNIYFFIVAIEIVFIRNSRLLLDKINKQIAGEIFTKCDTYNRAYKVNVEICLSSLTKSKRSRFAASFREMSLSKRSSNDTYWYGVREIFLDTVYKNNLKCQKYMHICI